MARTLPELGPELVDQIEQAWGQTQPAWARERLRVVRLIAQHELTAEQIAKACDLSRASVFNYRNLLIEGGVPALLKRRFAPGKKPVVHGAVAEEFKQRLEEGRFRSAKAAQAWIKKRTRKSLSESGALKVLRRLGGKRKSPRKSHGKKDPKKAVAFKAELPAKLAELAKGSPRPVRIWVLDEHRYGLLPVIRRVWALKGKRVHAPYVTKYRWGYLHEALEVDGKNACELLFTPEINQDWHQKFLEQIGQSDPDSLHVVIADQAGFHFEPTDPRVPANLKLLPLPPYSPELNPVERFGGLIKAQVSNRLYGSLKKLEGHIEAICRVWGQPQAVAGLIHDWLLEKVNCGAPA
jgi:transposase